MRSDRALAKAEAERTRREVSGISDRVEAAQQLDAPPFDTQLVGKRLEVCWPYKENGQTIKIWASGTVRRVADGINDKSSARRRRFCRRAQSSGHGRRILSLMSRPARSGSC